MSGIAGIIHFDGSPIEPGLIEKMTGAMSYRGPDGIHHWVKGSVALGQCMLRTTPESLEEHQPLSNEDESLVLVMDGRVDNWEELRRELLGRGAVLRDRSDAELVLRSYEIWGRVCLKHIDGDFALVIWDARRKEAFCARDRMGSKPFNYHWNGKTFVFASELHAILALPWVPENPNEGMLAEFLADKWYSRDETLWCGIMRLVAAHKMTVGSQGLQKELYWAPDLWATLSYTRDEEYIEHYRELLADSVRRMSRSHRTVAYEVSGGLDSSAVFCMAEHLRRSNRLPAPGIEGYTLAFTDDSEANELGYVRAVSEYLGTQIHEILPSIMPLSWYAERALFYRAFPGFPNGIMHQGLIRRASQQGTRVLLNGNGGDEWLGGSRAYYAEELALHRWAKLYECFKADVKVFGARKAMNWLIRHGFFPLFPVAFQKSLRRMLRGTRFSETPEAYWLSPHMQEVLELRRGGSSLPYCRAVPNSGQFPLLGYLHNAFSDLAVEEMERLNAGFGIDMRSPLNTPRLVQFAFSTPERLRLRGDRTKYIHLQALQGIMPQAILERTSKAAFPIVFCGHLDRMKVTFTETIPRERFDWVVPEGMAQLYRAYQANPSIGSPPWILWGVYACDKVFKS